MSGVRHNVMRFDIQLSYIWPMIEAGEVDMPTLIAKVREAIIGTIDKETEWECDFTKVVATGGDGRRQIPLHHEEIFYDFS